MQLADWKKLKLVNNNEKRTGTVVPVRFLTKLP